MAENLQVGLLDDEPFVRDGVSWLVERFRRQKLVGLELTQETSREQRRYRLYVDRKVKSLEEWLRSDDVEEEEFVHCMSILAEIWAGDVFNWLLERFNPNRFNLSLSPEDIDRPLDGSKGGDLIIEKVGNEIEVLGLIDISMSKSQKRKKGNFKTDLEWFHLSALLVAPVVVLTLGDLQLPIEKEMGVEECDFGWYVSRILKPAIVAGDYREDDPWVGMNEGLRKNVVKQLKDQWDIGSNNCRESLMSLVIENDGNQLVQESWEKLGEMKTLFGQMFAAGLRD